MVRGPTPIVWRWFAWLATLATYLYHAGRVGGNLRCAFALKMKLPLLLIALAAAFPFSSGVRAIDQGLVQLSSGREVRLLSVGELNFSNDRPAWWLRYETQISMEKTKEIEAEAIEVWNHFRPEAERSGKVNAAISAVEAGPNESTAAMYNIVFQKRADGTWVMR